MMDERLAIWIQELRRYNSRLHLMGPAMLKRIEDELEVMIPLLVQIDEPEIADLGSGSGLPAIPYKILHPGSKICLIERSQKKCTFLQHIVESIHLNDIDIKPNDPVHDTLGPFDAILARSFSPLSTLVDVCMRILRQNGRLYYLFTGSTPEFSQAFRKLEIITQKSVKHSLHLGVFIRIP